MKNAPILSACVIASMLGSMEVMAKEISCKVIVEAGDLIGDRNYYERYDGNPKRVVTKFNFQDGYFINYLGKRYSLRLVETGIYEMESSSGKKVRYLAEDDPSLVLELIVDRDASVLKVFECE